MLQDLLEKKTEYDLSNSEIQVCLYCLAILYKGCEDKSIGTGANEKYLLLSKMTTLQGIFIEALDHREPHNAEHKPVSPEKYKNFLKLFASHFQELANETPDCMSLNFWLCVAKNDAYPILASESTDWLNFSTFLGGTMQIIQDCLTPYKDNEDSGRMAIIRTSTVKSGIQFKQSLNIAKMKAGVYKLEVFQDFQGKHTSLDQAMQLAVDDAKVLDAPNTLRIKRRIQTDHCEHEKCYCEDYVPKNNFSLDCSKCSHIHKLFKSYQDLNKLPCLLILVNNGRMGDTFPQSFIALDDRASSSAKNNVYLTTFTQEKGRMCRYTALNEKLPYMFVNSKLCEQLEKSLNKDCSFYHSFFMTGMIDRKLKLNENGEPIPVKKHADRKLDHSKSKDSNFLLSAEPQCGKTGVYLNLIAEIRKDIEENTIVVEEDEEEEQMDIDDELSENPKIDDPFVSVVPHWELISRLERLPTCITTQSKYSR